MNNQSEIIRVICIDDHPLIIAGVKAILDGEPGMAFVAGATCAIDGILRFRQHRPDVGLVDLRLPDKHGSEVVSSIVQEFPSARLIALTTYKGDAEISRALKAGAKGYLLKDLMHKELVDAIRRVHKGDRYISEAAAVELAEHTPQVQLTTRELDVLRLMADGNRNKEIAGALGITEDTTKFHVKSILEKLGVHDRTHAVTVAIRRGMLHLH